MKMVIKKQYMWAIAALAVVGIAGGAGLAIYKKKAVVPVVAKVASEAVDVDDGSAYECYHFSSQCTAGDTGGCKQFQDTCRSAQSVRSSGSNTAQGVQECAAFKSQCVDGNYTSCNLYNRGCTQDGQS